MRIKNEIARGDGGGWSGGGNYLSWIIGSPTPYNGTFRCVYSLHF